jgi:hypothetical protein
MMMRLVLAGVAAIALVACQPVPQKPAEPPPAPAAQASAPADVIRPLYERYLHPTDPAVSTWPALEDQAPWSADLRAKLLAMIARSNAINEPILDHDPFVDAQDGTTANLTVTTDAVAENSHAVVRATFTQENEPREVLYDLIWEGGGWRIDNIRTSQWDLRQITSEGAPK